MQKSKTWYNGARQSLQWDDEEINSNQYDQDQPHKTQIEN